jgi:hypothetical protein
VSGNQVLQLHRLAGEQKVQRSRVRIANSGMILVKKEEKKPVGNRGQP